MTPISLALVDASFAEGERGRAVGLWASGSSVTTAGGPFLGWWVLKPWFFWWCTPWTWWGWPSWWSAG